MKERFENYLKKTSAEDSAVIERNTSPETQEEIEKVQLSKEEFVSRLKGWRAKFYGEGVENDLESDFGNRTLIATEQGFKTFTKGGVPIELTEGEIFAAMEWGTFWKFDDSVPKGVQQRVMFQQMKKLIASQYDEQLIKFGQDNKLSDDRKRNTYDRIAERPSQLEHLQDGILAEHMISSLLERAQRDYKLPFTFKGVDVYEDVENKIDFVIALESHKRGVHVSEQGSQVGVQFTLNPEKESQKQDQIDASKKRGEAEVDDIVLVSMPFAQVRQLFDQWRYDDSGNLKNEKTLDPRGPNVFISEKMEREILHALFSKLPMQTSRAELENLIRTKRSNSGVAVQQAA